MKNDEKRAKQKCTDTILVELASYGFNPSKNLVVSFANLLMSSERPLQILGGVDIRRFIKANQKAGDLNEALWSAFLAAYFDDPESAGRFLCAFENEPTWTWAYVSTKPSYAFRRELSAHQEKLKTLHCGNHRKFSSKQPDGLADMIESFVWWVEHHGGSPAIAFTPEEGSTPQQGFAELYQHFNVHSFGRLGRFDLLCLLGEMGLKDIEANSCYLVGSTGPLKGAKDLCGTSANRFSGKKLTRIMDDLAVRLGVSFTAMEDALCLLHKNRSNCSNQSSSCRDDHQRREC